MTASDTKCGFITLVGRPNVGKSSILNCLVNEKVSIISSKPQTTRHQIQGVKTLDEQHQVVYVDTPGIHQQAKTALNRYMNKAAKSSLHDVDLVLFVVEALKWTDEDAMVLELVKQSPQPAILVVNKVDKVKEKAKMLPFLQKLADMHSFETVIPVSALKSYQIEALEQKIKSYLPDSPFFYEANQKTNQSFEFQLAELVREQLMNQLNQELPYATAVQIEKITDLNAALEKDAKEAKEAKEAKAAKQAKENSENNQVAEQIESKVEDKPEENVVEIAETKTQTEPPKGPWWQVHALIWVEKPSQKAIIIGEKGERLKAIGRQARLAMNSRFDCRVDLRLWVKVKAGWSDNANVLPQFGYHAE